MANKNSRRAARNRVNHHRFSVKRICYDFAMNLIHCVCALPHPFVATLVKLTLVGQR